MYSYAYTKIQTEDITKSGIHHTLREHFAFNLDEEKDPMKWPDTGKQTTICLFTSCLTSLLNVIKVGNGHLSVYFLSDISFDRDKGK